MQAKFRQTLLRVERGATDQSNWAILHARSTIRVDEAERTRFDDNVHIFATNGEVNEWNWRRTAYLDTPIARINADQVLRWIHLTLTLTHEFP